MRIFLMMFGVVLLSVAAFSAQAEDQMPDGWGKLKFGMTVEQALKAEPRLVETFGSDSIWRSKKGAVEIGGQPFMLDVAFFDAGRLDNIKLLWDSIGISSYAEAESCEKFYDLNLRMLTKKYGKFHVPSKEELAKRKNDHIKKILISETSDGSAAYVKIFSVDTSPIENIFHVNKFWPNGEMNVEGIFWKDRSGKNNICEFKVTFLKYDAGALPLPKASKDGF